jgi:hypothetical protein
MRVVEFIKDFADKKAGDLFTCDGILASWLVNEDKVAKYPETEKKKKEAKKEK